MGGIQTNLKDMGKAAAQFKQTVSDNPQEQFEKAIACGHLSTDKEVTNYVGYYMYMGENDRVIMFKHINTREYYNLNK